MKYSNLVLAATCIATATALPTDAADRVDRTREGLALLRFSEDEDPVYYSLVEKYKLEEEDVHFMDVTDTWERREARRERVSNIRAVNAFAFPPISRQADVNATISLLEVENLKSYLATLTAFNNRHYRSTTGAQASDSILQTVTAFAANRTDIDVAQFTHSRINQKSVIARFAGSDATQPIVIFGAHLDSTAGSSSARAPGADDDGSGTVTLFEAFRALIASDFIPSTPLEFHWYAGEEGGLLGSQDVAATYADAGKAVAAMIQLDMTAYTPPNGEEKIVFITDNTDAGLTEYLTSLVGTYNAIPAGTSECGYGCSDHASWNDYGYPSAFPFEADFDSYNPNIHSSRDTINVVGFSWTHILEFTKLAVAAAIELTA